MSTNFLITVTAIDDDLPIARPVVECLDSEVLFDQVSDETLGALVRSLLVQSLCDPSTHQRGRCRR